MEHGACGLPVRGRKVKGAGHIAVTPGRGADGSAPGAADADAPL
jgi:hypothetical protein